MFTELGAKKSHGNFFYRCYALSFSDKCLHVRDLVSKWQLKNFLVLFINHPTMSYMCCSMLLLLYVCILE